MTYGDFSCLISPTETAKTPPEIKINPDKMVGVIGSPRIKAEDKTPSTGTPSDPSDVLIAGRLLETDI